MLCVTTILRLAGRLKPGFQIRIENPPWKDLVIRNLQQAGPHGIPAVSVAHYEGQKGTVVVDPEMHFEMETKAGEIVLRPFYYRNHILEVDRYSAFVKDGRMVVNDELQQENEDFADMWDQNLLAQGYAEVFLRKLEESDSSDNN